MSIGINAGFDRVTNSAMDYAKEAMRYNWNLADSIEALKQAWIYAHEDELRHAKWQVEQVKS